MMDRKDVKVKTVQAVDRTLGILDTLGKEGVPMTLTALSAELKLNISTVHRLLSTLIVWGFVEQELDTGKYKLGIKAFEIGNAVFKNLDLCKVAKPILKDLVEKFSETVNLAVLDGREVVYIEQVESKNVIKMMAKPGTRGPAYCTGSGKTLLAKLTDREIDRMFGKYNFIKYTENTVDSVERLKEKLDEIRKKGYAIDQEEIEAGVRCAAVPVYNHEGNMVAALSITGPGNRLSYEYLKDEIVPELLSAAMQISRSLGNHHIR
ncbi:MAG: IclR family transcriptional regulator [Bacillota bacterium]|nr:IclR family transcriptional regulator [Bacillota bacterium]